MAHSVEPFEQARKSNELVPKMKKQKKWLSKLTPFFFISPHLIFFFIFLIIPTFYGIYLSFHSWNFFDEPYFVGLQNYADLLVNKDSPYYNHFWQSFKNTLIFVVFSVPFLILIPLLLALALNTKPVGSNFFRALFYAPSLLSVATVVLIWVWILDTNAGLVNYYLNKFGLDSIAWLTSLPWAWVSLIVMTIWWTVGFNMILFLAGLNDVPQELYEAAKIDGANVWQRFLYVTIPGLKAPMIFVVIMTTIASFNIFGQPFMGTRGGPGTETRVLLMYIYEVGFTGGNPRAGVAAAMAIIMGAVLLVISIIQFKLLNRENKTKKIISKVEG